MSIDCAKSFFHQIKLVKAVRECSLTAFTNFIVFTKSRSICFRSRVLVYDHLDLPPL